MDEIGKAQRAQLYKSTPSTNKKTSRKKTEESEKKSDSPQLEEEGVSISEGAQLIAQVMDSLEDIPEVREEKVDEMKKRILNGDYDISAEIIAEKMTRKD